MEEARTSEEEDSDIDLTASIRAFCLPIEQLKRKQTAQRDFETKQRQAVKRQVLALLQRDEHSQPPTPLMSLVFPDTLRESVSSTATITGPGGSFHMDEVFHESPQHSVQDDASSTGNQRIIRSCVAFLMPGDLFQAQRTAVYEALSALSSTARLAVLLGDCLPTDHFLGVYEVKSTELRRITGDCPDCIPRVCADQLLQYLPDSNLFIETQAWSSIDAFRLRVDS